MGRRQSSVWSIFAILLSIFVIVPLLIIVLMSFSKGQFFTFPPESFSSRWYERFFGTEGWVSSVGISAVIALGSAVLSTVLAVPAALWVSKAGPLLKRTLIVFFSSPLMIPLIVLATGDYFLFSYMRMTDSLTGIVIAHAVLGMPFVFIVTLAALVRSDGATELAALNLGATTGIVQYKVRLPLIRSAVLLGFLFAALNSLNEVVIVLFLSGTTIKPLSAKMWEGFRFEVNPTIAVAAEVAILCTVICLFAITLLRKLNLNNK